MDHEWDYGGMDAAESRHRSCTRCKARQRTFGTGSWDDPELLDAMVPGSRNWEPGAGNPCLDPAMRPRELEWRRVEDDHPRWEIGNPLGDGRDFLCTDALIRTYGRRHVEGRLLANLPTLPEEAWAVAGE